MVKITKVSSEILPCEDRSARVVELVVGDAGRRELHIECRGNPGPLGKCVDLALDHPEEEPTVLSEDDAKELWASCKGCLLIHPDKKKPKED